MKKQVVDNQQYESLLSMLNSKNDQDKVLGLVTILLRILRLKLN